MFTGILIEESLTSKDCLGLLRITATTVEPVTKRHKTPWLKQWTLHQFAIDDATAAEAAAAALQESLDPEHPQAWYVDFQDDAEHFIVFKSRIFRIDRSQPEQYAAVAAFGQELGIPPTQLDFAPLRP